MTRTRISLHMFTTCTRRTMACYQYDTSLDVHAYPGASSGVGRKKQMFVILSIIDVSGLKCRPGDRLFVLTDVFRGVSYYVQDSSLN
jgi:hypothetical protein